MDPWNELNISDLDRLLEDDAEPDNTKVDSDDDSFTRTDVFSEMIAPETIFPKTDYDYAYLDKPSEPDDGELT